MIATRVALAGMLALTALHGSAKPAVAQKPEPAAGESPGDPLPDRQSVVRDRIRRFEDRMFELSRVLRKVEPDRAAKLLDALGASRSLRIRQKLDDIVDKLKRESYSDATDGQAVVTADLESLLKLLLEEPDKLEERKREIERLERLRQSLNELIEEQKKERAAAEASIAAAERADALEAAADRVKQLLERQQDASAGGTGGAMAPAQSAAAQGEIRKDTESLAENLDSLAPEEEAGKKDTTDAKPGDGKPSDGSAGSDAGDAAGDAAKDLRNAAEKMKSAEQKLDDADSESAGGDQKGAEKDLEAAIDKLEAEAKTIRNKLQLEKQAEDQRKTAEKTKQLADEMKGESDEGSEGGEGGEQGGEQGQQQGGQEGGQEGGQQGEPQEGGDPNNQPAPGQQDVEGAIPLQEDAADELDKQDPEDAAKKQQEALDKLEQAQDELDDVLEQLRREQQEELLAALEARFRAMLARQLECNKATDRLADLGTANWKRSDQLELAEISQRQRWVGTEAGKALEVLVEDGTTVVFPQVIEQVRDDSLDLADRIAAADVGYFVRSTQVEIADTIRQLLDAVKRMQQENESGGGGGGGGPNSPLLPGSAELKLLKACQLRVNRATDNIDLDRLMPDVTVPDIKGRLSKLDNRQKNVANMAKDMHEAMTRAQ